ncbi:MAG: Rne/Rng family ribonuclease [Planctomycetota bacterium]|jgi:ribonuclease E|nr:Rne/Rng family ribonuclease [Planctomycetia bacterium]RLT01628.1 MAG: Rne/Rng family ribonuclease [Planctomycetota bacterium]
MKQEMLINVSQPEECRIAIMENGVLEELYVERTSQDNYVGNIYKGRIVNIEPSIQAAFVDFGVGRNGFLHISDVEPQYYRQGGLDPDKAFDVAEPSGRGLESAEEDADARQRTATSRRPRLGDRPRVKPPIQDVLRRGDEVLVQVIKEGFGTKGPTLSTYISIPGRYLVLMPPLGRVGISKKIDDEHDRRMLRDIMLDLQPPKGVGFVVRTAGTERTKSEMARDMTYLLRLWKSIVRRMRKYSAPIDIYQESDMIIRTIRDMFTEDVGRILIDEPAAYERAREFLELVMPKYVSRLQLYDGKEPLFHRYGLEEEISRIHQRKVPLKGGGSIVIDQTEALVAIDVNSGSFRTDKSAEENAYQMNIIAAKEIARQLRLRDLGGVIVNDFIDMRRDRYRRGVEKALYDAMKRDRARTKILRTSPFGLIEMTRQRIRPSLRKSIFRDCPTCTGTGMVKTAESMAIEVMRTLQLSATRDDIARLNVTVHDEVAAWINNRKRREIAQFEDTVHMQLHVVGKESVSPEHMMFEAWDSNSRPVRFP